MDWNRKNSFGRSIKTADLNDNQTNTADSENLEEEVGASGENKTVGSSTIHANVTDYENEEEEEKPEERGNGVNETVNSTVATKSHTTVVASGIMNESEPASASHLPTIGPISLNKSNIKEHFEKQNKVVEKAFGRSIILSPPNFDSHENRHLVNSRKCGRSAVI